MIFILSSDCQVTIGYLRSSILDLGRQKYYLFEKKIVNDLINNSVLEEKIQTFLESEEIIFKVSKETSNNFPRLELKFDSNQLISSCISSFYDFNNIKIFEKIGCRNFTLLIHDFDKNKKNIFKTILDIHTIPVDSIELCFLNNNLKLNDLIPILS